MAQNSEIQKAIDQLYAVEAKSRPDEIKFFLERLHTSYSEAHRSMIRQSIAFSSIWLVVYAIREGAVSGGEVASFEVERLELFLLASPLLLGAISYLLLASANAQALMREALHYCYKNSLPTAYHLDLHYMLYPPSLLNIERLFLPRGRAIALGVIRGIGAFIIFGPLLGILHCVYLSWSVKELPALLIILSGMAGIALWVRGIIMLFTDYETPGDYPEVKDLIGDGDSEQPAANMVSGADG